MTQGSEEPSRTSGVDDRLARHGGLSYLEIPAPVPRQSAIFYQHVLGWRLDERSSADIRFSDASGHLIGRWVSGCQTCREPGLLPYFHVKHVDDAVEQVASYGGEVVKAPSLEGDTWVATVRDPAGNVLGLWQDAAR